MKTITPRASPRAPTRTSEPHGKHPHFTRPAHVATPQHHIYHAQCNCSQHTPAHTFAPVPPAAATTTSNAVPRAPARIPERQEHHPRTPQPANAAHPQHALCSAHCNCLLLIPNTASRRDQHHPRVRSKATPLQNPMRKPNANPLRNQMRHHQRPTQQSHQQPFIHLKQPYKQPAKIPIILQTDGNTTPPFPPNTCPPPVKTHNTPARQHASPNTSHPNTNFTDTKRY